MNLRLHAPSVHKHGADPVIKFTGEDVLGFCMLTGDASTTGVWHLAFEGESNGLLRNSGLGFASTEDGTRLYFTTKNTFPAGLNKVLPFDQPAGPLGAPLFDTAALGVAQTVDSIDVEE